MSRSRTTTRAGAQTQKAFRSFALFAALAGVASALWLWPAGDERELVHVHEPTDHDHLHSHDDHHQHEHQGWEGVEPHSHRHTHGHLEHRHTFVIDLHHQRWPTA